MPDQKGQRADAQATRKATMSTSGANGQIVILPQILDRLTPSMTGAAEVTHGKWHAILHNGLTDTDIEFDVRMVAAVGYSVIWEEIRVMSGPGVSQIIGRLRAGQKLNVHIPLGVGENRETAKSTIVAWDLRQNTIRRSS